MYKSVSIPSFEIVDRVCAETSTAMMSRVSVAVIGAGVLRLHLSNPSCDTNNYISRSDRHHDAQTAATGRFQCYFV